MRIIEIHSKEHGTQTVGSFANWETSNHFGKITGIVEYDKHSPNPRQSTFFLNFEEGQSIELFDVTLVVREK